MNPQFMATAPPESFGQPALLYISNLDKTVTDNLVYLYFSKFGPINGFKILKNIYTHESRGVAWIEYRNHKDAEAAKNQLNNERLHNRYIQILWKGENLKANNDARIFVSNLPSHITQNGLESYFQRFGPVLSTRLFVDNRCHSLGYGYIQYREVDDALKCLKEAQEKPIIIDEKEVVVETFKSRMECDLNRMEHMRNLYIRNLPEGCDEAAVRALFKSYGEIRSMVVNKAKGDEKKDEEAKETPYYALVALDTHEAAERALNDLNDKEKVLPGQTVPLFVSWHKTPTQLKEARRLVNENDREQTLYMRNLKADVTAEKINEVLKKVQTLTAPNGIHLQHFEASEGPSATAQKYATQSAFVKMSSKDQAQTILGLVQNDADIKSLFINDKAFIDIALSKIEREKMKRTQRHKGFQPQFPGFVPQPGFRPNSFPMPMFLGPLMPFRAPIGAPMPQQGAQQGGFVPRGGRYQGHPRGGAPSGHYQHGGRPVHQGQGGQRGGGPRVGQRTESAPAAPKKMTLETIEANLQNFKALKQDEQRNVLGELLYPHVLNTVGREFAPKITGMLVDFDVMTVEEILDAIKDQDVLKQRVAEAKEALTEANE